MAMKDGNKILAEYRARREKERLREKFATRAMEALIKADIEFQMDREAIAKEAFRQADSMVETMFMSKEDLYDLKEVEDDIEEGFIDIVFDGPPSNEAPRFVEVEDEKGKSISVGGWMKREDGYWVLRIPRWTETTEIVEENG